MLICLSIVNGCFHTTMAELSAIEARSPTKLKIFAMWPFTQRFADPPFHIIPPL